MSEPFAGKKLSEKSLSITPEILNDFHSGLDLPASADVSVPTMVLSDIESGYFSEIAFPYQQGHLWMRQEWELHDVVNAGETYSGVGEIEEIYVRRNRNVVKYRVEIRKKDGTLTAVTWHHQSFLREQLQSESVEFRAPEAKPGARKFEVPDGAAFGGLNRVITKEMCGVFFHGDANYHTDDEAAHKLSFAQVVVGGRMTMSYVGAILEERFGERWLKSGVLDLKFTNPVWCDDEVTANGVVLPGGSGADREEAFVWLSKQDGSIAIVANASVAR